MADVTLPQLGETVTEGTITQWFKQVGDTVAEDEPLFEVSTDKVDTEVPSPIAGVVSEIRVPEGDTIEVGTVVAVVGDAAPPPRRPHPPPSRHRSPPRAGTGARPRAGTGTGSRPGSRGSADARVAGCSRSPPTATAGDNRLLSPVVRRLVNEHSLNPDDITGTGPGGRITREDVLDHIDAVGSTPAAGAGPQLRLRHPPRRLQQLRLRRRRPPRRRRPRRRRHPMPASATPSSSCRRSGSSPATTW